jgi:hypothetical protein
MRQAGSDPGTRNTALHGISGRFANALFSGEPGWWVPLPGTRREPIHGDSGATSLLLTVPGNGTHHPGSWHQAKVTVVNGSDL